MPLLGFLRYSYPMKKFKAAQGYDLATLPKTLDFSELESRLAQRWQNDKAYAFNEKSEQPVFAVDTPPPTVSGSLHVGHIFSYTQTDVIARYHRMLGKNVFYPMGWDDNGLPTERRVQNYFHIRCEPTAAYEAGLNLPPVLEVHTEKEIKDKRIPQKDLSRKNFIEHCHKVTVQDEEKFKELFSRVGLSVDWNLEYATIDDHCRKISQLSFLDLFKKNELYQVEAPTLWDTDFQTAVAQAELEDRELPGAFHEIEFLAKDVEASRASFVIATTRPELLPACVGVATHPSDSRYQHLIGKKAKIPLFDLEVPIFASELVNPEKGTGILMVCTFGDQTDVQWWREQKLELRQAIGRDGRMQPLHFSTEQATQNYALVQGRNLKQAQKIIVEELQKLGVLKAVKPLQHAVKFYEKGDRPVEILTTRQWFVKLVDKKEALIEAGKKIKWHPEFMESRYRNWTENLNLDWCISRQRFFGVSIPVWYPLNEKGQIQYEKPMVATEAQMPVDPMFDAPQGYQEGQRGKPNGFIGEADVFDTWFTSSVTPQIATKWSLDTNRHSKLFPMSIRPQSHEIIRTWAFYTIAKAMLHEKKIPWEHILISGWILDPDRKKMSKSKGNVVTPMQFIEDHGADAVRYWASNARYGVDTAFDPNVMKVGRRLAMKIFNAGKFVLSNTAVEGAITEPLDLAFITKLKKLCVQAKKSFDEFEPAQALMDTEKFFWTHFTDTYLELVKGRTWNDGGKIDELEKASAVHALRLGLKTLLKLFAPVLPYTTEEVWQLAFTGESKSIHQALFPTEKDFEGVGEGIPEAFDIAVAVQTAVNQQKTISQVSIARPIEKLKLKMNAQSLELFHSVKRDVALAIKADPQVISVETTNEFEVGLVQVLEVQFLPEKSSE